ncbi:hypothetical protein TrVE_jg12538 [Triparma verrucosa]|uniref:EGF domain-specific O-linked N-acetylglucosamine transferase n=1 Tax=Triparma verrucosa TaxID=1606542 RepID=A0A9W7FGW2_9STRA|nr:hypothetical protein TrVE_jg12538 [Triparma verrucosa]
MEIVYNGLGIERSKVVLFDRQPDGPFYELIEKGFSEGKLKRSGDFKGKVRFEKLIFHLESPAGIVFPKIGQKDKSLECYNSVLWRKYAARVLKAFDLYDVQPPAVPSLTLILRERTQEKNVGRVLDNRAELESVMRKCTLCDVKVVDLAGMPYKEQIRLIRSTNVLVGVHGAGLMNIIFAAEEAVLVEIHPHYRQDRHFRIASRMSGKIYMPMRTKKRVTCQGSSDDVYVEVDEFERTLDGAVRIAREFNRGMSECGLVCRPEILAIDAGLNNEYGRLGVKMGDKGNMRFPCG